MTACTARNAYMSSWLGQAMQELRGQDSGASIAEAFFAIGGSCLSSHDVSNGADSCDDISIFCSVVEEPS